MAWNVKKIKLSKADIRDIESFGDIQTFINDAIREYAFRIVDVNGADVGNENSEDKERDDFIKYCMKEYIKLKEEKERAEEQAEVVEYEVI